MAIIKCGEFDIDKSRWGIEHDLRDVRSRLIAMRSVVSWGDFLFDCEGCDACDEVDIDAMHSLVSVIDDLLEKQIAKMDVLIDNTEKIFSVLIANKASANVTKKS